MVAEGCMGEERVLDFASLLGGLPAPWPEEGLRERLREGLVRSGSTLVVVDDDPTGTQTVHGVVVVTRWDEGTLRGELERCPVAFYVLTNSRALGVREAVALSEELGANLRRASASAGRRVLVLSRSDSTLRGHFPQEVEALARGMGLEPDGILLVPFFAEGGRYTVGDVHYVREGSLLVPVGRTEFARDPAFGFRHSHLGLWVEEKSGGRWRAGEVVSIPLELVRGRGPEGVAEVLERLEGGVPVVVNAVSERDLEVVALGVCRAEAAGKRFIYRTAASFAKVRAGIADRGLLGPDELLCGCEGGAGGLVIVGSYVPRTTRQLEALLGGGGWRAVELDVRELLAAGERALGEVVHQVSGWLGRGEDVVVYTSRELVRGADREESLRVGDAVAGALASLVRGLGVRPRFIVAKGGVTTSRVATDGLGVVRAQVLGQVEPGVPVWRLGQESLYPGLTYVVFPGNVGEEESLVRVCAALRAA